ncbi:MAG: thioredoxin domain-containing protein [Sphingobacteriaceae bacterium]|nr:thioredoxin domain-containing protein [Sphingobacteriaceae bacterium]
MAQKEANALVNESSPYLLQHAYNPVKWQPWSNSAFEEAKNQNKLVIISVGYSACHWCHVMEHESFEDEEVAALMNEHFISVKVDREERPDVDNLYMTAVQLMTGHGGWPLNCIALPDGRPVYGGTYFNKMQWLNVLTNLVNVFKKDKEKVLEYANNLTEGIKQAELVATTKYPENIELEEALKKGVQKWKGSFDNEHGGPNRAPKFPLPNNYIFLLRYGYLYKDKEVLDHVNLTLTKMACGGIYDQLHGGFARYSTDGIWKLPHFEKMLYDNSQLVSLYCETYRLTKNTLYKTIVEETLDFVMNEWLKPEGCFFSAYDADSEGVEGKFYVWSKEELHSILKDDFELFAKCYQVNEVGYWEDENYILMRAENWGKIAAEHQLNLESLNAKINGCKQKLKTVAAKRIKPGLDDKTIVSWNALMAKGFADAYACFGNVKHKEVALKCCDFILKQQINKNGLHRIYKNGTTKIPAFLDDYAFIIDVLLSANLIDTNSNYLTEAQKLMDHVLKHFQHTTSELFYYSSTNNNELITQQTETSDNVIPASNSQMALNLFNLGILMQKPNYIEKAKKMLHLFAGEIGGYAPGYSNWGCLALNFTKPHKELVIVGNNVDEIFLDLHKYYFTNTTLVGSNKASELPLITNRFKDGETLIYVCKNNTCDLPVKTVLEAIKKLEDT